jgi:DNA-nicking Smr family endonuclease
MEMKQSENKSDTINETAADITAESCSEADMFRNAVADARPMQANRTEPFKPGRRPQPIEQPAEPEQAVEFSDRTIQTHDELLFMRPGVQKRRFLQLQRGRIIPEETIDLHGYRVEQARPLLRRFIEHSRLRAYQCVRIIHGKGKRSSTQQPILKQKVNQWLPQAEGVLAYCSAPRWDGGTGATYVLLARIKQRDRITSDH